MVANVSDFMEDAEQILSQKNTGPSGVLAYAWANAVKTVEVKQGDKTYSFNMPFVDPDSDKEPEPYFAVIKTDRVGIEVAVPPGGTQDIIFDLDGKEQYAELVKPEKQKHFLTQALGINLEPVDDTVFVAALLSSPRVDNLRLEPAFFAAVRETEEEQGWSYFQNEPKVVSSYETDQELLSKRSFKTNPPTPVLQKLFVVEVQDFEGTIPVRNDKVESKIIGMTGNHFYEQGDFMSLSDLEDQLEAARIKLEQEGDTLPAMAEIDYKATISRVDMVRRVVNKLQP